MPTPAGNAPDPNLHSVRTQHFSSCPDPEDNEQQPEEPQQQQQQSLESPVSPASASSPSSQNLDTSQESQSSSWRPESSSSLQSQYPGDDSTSPRSDTMSPMSSSVAAALADGSRDYESLDERPSVGSGLREPQGMEVDEGDDDQQDDEEEETGISAEEERRMLAAAMRRDYVNLDDETSDSEDSLAERPVTNLQEHLVNLTRRNARNAARYAERAARAVTGEGSALDVPSTSRRRPDAVRSRSAADHGTRPGGDASSSTRDDDPEATAWGADTSMLGLGYEYADPRVVPICPSTYLRPGSRFHGTQQSERQQYDVQVEIKHVDLRESFLCGYLRIQGLTEDHPTLTTYFEGEIIGTKYGFSTQQPSWGASDKTDLSHWAKFQAFRPFQKQMKKGGGGSIVIRDVANRENIFMRWKEHFLVPDHRVRTIHGASFEGFYYICFNQLRGEVSGIYFHSKSEKFQQLELKHVEDRGCYGAVEFR